MHTCMHCQKTFTVLSSLNHHQLTAKSCLALRGLSVPPNPCCQFCEKSCSTAYRLREHERVCEKRGDEKKEENFEQLRSEIERLREENQRQREELVEYRVNVRALEDRFALTTKMQEERLNAVMAESQTLVAELRDRLSHTEQMYENRLTQSDKMLTKRTDDLAIIAKQAKIRNTTNNIFHGNVSLDLSNTQQIHNLLEEHLDDAALRQGQVGLARVVVSKMLTNEDGQLLYVCTDTGRRHFQYQTADGAIQRDLQAARLKEALTKSGLRRLAIEKGEKLWTNDDGSTDTEILQNHQPAVHEVATLAELQRDTKFEQELARLTTVSS